MTTSQEAQQINPTFSEHTLHAYAGFRSWNQLNVNANTQSDEYCGCCALIRQSLIEAAVSKDVIVWLVDVGKLHTVVKSPQNKDSKRCGFCHIIYQQFWAWQDARYRLRSQLWARTLRKIENEDEMVHVSEIKKIWDDLSKQIDQYTDACFQDTHLNSARVCSKSTCNICVQDNHAKLAFGDLSNLCEPCRKVVVEHSPGDDLNARLQPVVPLCLRPTISSDDKSLPTLRVKHAAGERANSGTASEWIWRMYALPDNRAAAYIPAFRHASYDDRRVYDQIISWMKACETHEACKAQRPKSPKLPRRVLDVSGTSCKLLETNDTGQYVALSYCWGAPQPQKLTTSNVESYKERIDVEQLPKTIQEAITVTKNLGFRYLWIDSMNIIQDDEADKLREISKMREVYRHSSLTICAAGARWCTEGFFDTARIPGTTFRMPDIGINYPCALPDGSMGHVRLVERAEYWREAEALNGRGWTYQEQNLPVSIVQFGACLSWECNELSECKTATSLTGGLDCDIPFSTLFVIHNDTQHKMRRLLHEVTEAPVSSWDELSSEKTSVLGRTCATNSLNRLDLTPQNMAAKCTCVDGPFFATWQLAILNYTERQLGDPADKLPAFAGLAEQFSRRRKDTYLAGLWKRHLLHDLMWTTRPPRGGTHTYGTADKRRQAWRAPSWSWACLDAGIDVVGAHKRILECPLDACENLGQMEASEICDCGIELQNPMNPFGAVKSGYIVVKGPLLNAKLMSGKYLVTLRIDGVQLSIATSGAANISHPDDFASPNLDLVFDQNPDLEGHGNSEWLGCLELANARRSRSAEVYASWERWN